MARSVRTTMQTRSAGGDKRELILRSATKVFAERGFFNSKVADIAKQAGIADGTVYLYFKSKDEILHSIFDKAMDEFISEGRRKLEGIDAPVERLKKIAQLHLEKLSEDRDMAIVFQVELRGSTKFMEEFSAAGFADYLQIISDTIKHGQDTGEFRSDIKAIVCAKILFGALDEMVTNWILSKQSYPLKPMAETVLQIFFGGVMRQ